MTTRARIIATGSYLPEKCMTNKDMESIVDTSDEWIVQRTGIKSRHIAADDQTTLDLAYEAAKDALARGNLTPGMIDCVIVCTSTPNNTFPSVAAELQGKLGIPVCPAFDLQAVCSGFVYGLSVANMFIQSGQSKRILLIGAEKFSSILDWNDRTTCVLFGDGAGAVVLERTDNEDEGILSIHLYADGTKKDILYTSGGVSSTQDSGFVVMEGKEVFKNAVTLMADIVDEVLTKNNITASDIDWLVPHQANIRIIEATAKKLDMPMEKVVVTVDRHGNTSAASIPLALSAAVNDGRIKKGDTILFEALGAGLTWGAVLAKF